jgi:hypothetical protein
MAIEKFRELRKSDVVTNFWLIVDNIIVLLQADLHVHLLRLQKLYGIYCTSFSGF